MRAIRFVKVFVRYEKDLQQNRWKQIDRLCFLIGHTKRQRFFLLNKKKSKHSDRKKSHQAKNTSVCFGWDFSFFTIT